MGLIWAAEPERERTGTGPQGLLIQLTVVRQIQGINYPQAMQLQLPSHPASTPRLPLTSPRQPSTSLALTSKNAHFFKNTSNSGPHWHPLPSAHDNGIHSQQLIRQSKEKDGSFHNGGERWENRTCSTPRGDGELERLTRLCGQLGHDNQALRQELVDLQAREAARWKGTVAGLEQELRKVKLHLEQRNRQLLCRQGANKTLSTIGDHYEHRLISGRRSLEAQLEQMSEKLRQKQQEIIRYIQKETKYIQAYVQNEHLEQQARTMRKTIDSLQKQLNKHRDKQTIAMPVNLVQTCDCQSKMVEFIKMTQYTEKLADLLQKSGAQIERLDGLLGSKCREIESYREEIKALEAGRQARIAYIEKHKQMEIKQRQAEIGRLAQQIRQIQTAQKACTKQVKQLELISRTKSDQNQGLIRRLQQQSKSNERLRQLVSNLQGKLYEQKTSQASKYSNAETNTLDNLKTQEVAVEADNQVVKMLEQENQQLQRIINLQNLQIGEVKKSLNHNAKLEESFKRTKEQFEALNRQMAVVFKKLEHSQRKLEGFSAKFVQILEKVAKDQVKAASCLQEVEKLSAEAQKVYEKLKRKPDDETEQC